MDVWLQQIQSVMSAVPLDEILDINAFSFGDASHLAVPASTSLAITEPTHGSTVATCPTFNSQLNLCMLVRYIVIRMQWAKL